MSDRVAVMRGGQIEQCAAPQELYEEPTTAFVANFLGAANLIPVTASGDGKTTSLTLGRFSLRTEDEGDVRGEAMAMIRPEYVRIEPQGTEGENCIPGMVEEVVYLGFHQDVRVRLATGALLRGDVPNDGDAPEYESGDPVSVHLRPKHLRVLHPDCGGRSRRRAVRGRRSARTGARPREPGRGREPRATRHAPRRAARGDAPRHPAHRAGERHRRRDHARGRREPGPPELPLPLQGRRRRRGVRGDDHRGARRASGDLAPARAPSRAARRVPRPVRLGGRGGMAPLDRRLGPERPRRRAARDARAVRARLARRPRPGDRGRRRAGHVAVRRPGRHGRAPGRGARRDRAPRHPAHRPRRPGDGRAVGAAARRVRAGRDAAGSPTARDPAPLRPHPRVARRRAGRRPRRGRATSWPRRIWPTSTRAAMRGSPSSSGRSASPTRRSPS